MLTEIERARYAFLITMCQHSDGMVHRSYLHEKVEMIYGYTEVSSIRGMLDSSRQRTFDKLMGENNAD